MTVMVLASIVVVVVVVYGSCYCSYVLYCPLLWIGIYMRIVISIVFVTDIIVVIAIVLFLLLIL